jgi:hypothetical protein
VSAKNQRMRQQNTQEQPTHQRASHDMITVSTLFGNCREVQNSRVYQIMVAERMRRAMSPHASPKRQRLRSIWRSKRHTLLLALIPVSFPMSLSGNTKATTAVHIHSTRKRKTRETSTRFIAGLAAEPRAGFGMAKEGSHANDVRSLVGNVAVCGETLPYHWQRAMQKLLGRLCRIRACVYERL